MRLNDGTVRALEGVAGSFTLGQGVLRGVDALHFDGSGGWALSGDEILTLDAEGTVLRRELWSDTVELRRDDAAYIDGDDLVVRASGRRLRLPFAVDRLERAGGEYIALSGPEGRLLARITEGREALFALPEAGE